MNQVLGGLGATIPVLLVVFFSFLIIVLWSGVLSLRKSHTLLGFTQGLCRGVLALWPIVLCAFTFTPGRIPDPGLSLIPGADVASMSDGVLLVNIVGNLLLFGIPALALKLFRPHAWTVLRIMFAAGAISGLIESAQFLTGRNASIDDVFLNVAGGVIGWASAELFLAGLNRMAERRRT
jgi:glycopeptide antibiotics resistance protein